MGGGDDDDTQTETQGHGHSVFPPPPIWHHTLGSYAKRGQREQGENMPNQTNFLPRSPATESNKHVSVLSESIPEGRAAVTLRLPRSLLQMRRTWLLIVKAANNKSVSGSDTSPDSKTGMGSVIGRCGPLDRGIALNEAVSPLSGVPRHSSEGTMRTMRNQTEDFLAFLFSVLDNKQPLLLQRG